MSVKKLAGSKTEDDGALRDGTTFTRGEFNASLMWLAAAATSVWLKPVLKRIQAPLIPNTTGPEGIPAQESEQAGNDNSESVESKRPAADEGWSGTYVIAEPCIGVRAGACVAVCPVDAIHPVGAVDPEGFRETMKLFIDPEACIGCHACVPECPVDAGFEKSELPNKWKHFAAENADYFRRRRSR